MNETDYETGSRAAWTYMLGECLRHLGYDSPETQKAGWIIEREAAIQVLRSACEHFGDNEWDDTLHLADVIEKHLGRHLHANEPYP